MRVLGIESSCDETAVAVVEDAARPEARVLAHALSTQLAEHKPYGGVVPEIAARAHLDKIDELVESALTQAELTLHDVDAFAATCGPGLIGGVMVGAMTGKAFAAVTGKPFIAVNHLEAHALTPRLSHDVAFPYVLLLASGGHCQILLAEGVGKYRCLGTTRDDAAGECFDKSAKLLGLGYPGGPMIEAAAKKGRADAFSLPHPMEGRAGCDFSFSGLKTAVRLEVDKAQKPLSASFVADMAASLQEAVAAIFEDRIHSAFMILREEGLRAHALVVSGGVAANAALRARLENLARREGVAFAAPPIALCTDNGVMVAWAGLERLRLGLTDDLTIRTRPRWPLEELRGKIG